MKREKEIGGLEYIFRYDELNGKNSKGGTGKLMSNQKRVKARKNRKRK